MSKKALLLLPLLTLTSLELVAQEGNLQSPLDFETTKVLPKGIRNLRFRGMMIDANDKYNSTGNTVPVGNALNKGVTWNKIIDGKDSDVEKGQLQGFLEGNGVDLNEEVGSTTGVVNVGVFARVPILAYGITEKFTAALAVPYITTDVSVDTGFNANSGLSSFAQNALNNNGKSDKAYELQYKTLNAINEKLKKYGYDPLVSENKSHLGDIRMINKYAIKNEAAYALTVRNDVTFPTGAPTSANKAVDVATGDGQFDVGGGLIADYFFNDNLTFTAYGGYIVQLPSHIAKRIPEESDSKLSPAIDYNTRSNLGDQFRSQLAAKYAFLNGFLFSSGYTYQYKQKDEYTGSQYDAVRYAWMSQDTDQKMHTAQLALGYSTINLFRQKKFPVPLEANIYHTRVFSGKNVVRDPSTSLEFAMFF